MTRTESFAHDADRRLRGRAARNPAQSAPHAVWHAVHRSTDLRRLEEAAIRLQAPVGTGRRIAVTSSRGGTGRTTLTAVLAQTLGRFRLEPIGAVDLDPGHGALRLRLGPLVDGPDAEDGGEGGEAAEREGAGPGERGAATADRVAQHIRDHGTGGAADFLAPLEASPHRVYHTAARTTRQVLPQDHVAGLLTGFSRFFPVTLSDCAAGHLPVETAAAVASSHAVLHVVPADALAVDEALHFLTATGQHTRRTPEPHVVVAVVQHRSRTNADARDAASALRRRGFPVHVVPFDRHLDTGVSVTPRLMLPRTRAVAAELAADLLERATARSAQSALTAEDEAVEATAEAHPARAPVRSGSTARPRGRA